MANKILIDINALMRTLTPERKNDPAIAHALMVRSSMATGNYHRFFKLYLQAPNMGGYLMDKFMERERIIALRAICKALVSFLIVKKVCQYGANLDI